jgi:type I restriction enzyme S subunit
MTHNTFNKKKWRTVSLEELVVKKEETERNAQLAGFTKFIKVVHFDKNSLHIKRWGNIIEDDLPPTFYKVFRNGQMLYPTRNPHLQRAALAEFDGICGEKTLTLEPLANQADKRFLPFLMQSGLFISHATNCIIGSTNPHVRWRDVAKLKFKLPPLDEQKRLADLLWSVDEGIMSYEMLLSQLLRTRSAVLKSIYSDKSFKELKIADLPIKEINGMWKTDEANDAMQVSIIRSTEIQPYGEIAYDTAQKHMVKKAQFANKKLTPGDIIVERSGGGPDQPVGRVCYFDKEVGEYTFSNFTSVIRVQDQNEVLPQYLFNFLLFFYEMKGTDRLQKQTTGIRNLDYDLYRKIKFPLRSKKEQEECIDVAEEINMNRKNIVSQIRVIRDIQKQIINQIFG